MGWNYHISELKHTANQIKMIAKWFKLKKGTNSTNSNELHSMLTYWQIEIQTASVVLSVLHAKILCQKLSSAKK